jgi:hypothetical protein
MTVLHASNPALTPGFSTLIFLSNMYNNPISTIEVAAIPGSILDIVK